MIQMYKALVHSHLDHYGILYHISAHPNQPPLGMSLNSLMEEVERIQHKAALAISDAWHGSSRSKLYKELGWETLSDLRMCRHTLQIHQILNNKTSSYRKDKLLPNCRVLFSGNIQNTFPCNNL